MQSTGLSLPSVAIIGAGIAGLSVAWRLAQQGCRVTVFERGKAGQGASWAAAGMLAAGVETEPGEEALYALTAESQRHWPAFAAELQKTSGLDLALRQEGTLVVARSRDDLARLQRRTALQQRLGIDLRWQTAAELRALEPCLKPGLAGGLWSPADHQVDNRALVLALRAAAVAAGVLLQEKTPVA